MTPRLRQKLKRVPIDVPAEAPVVQRRGIDSLVPQM
jgi:hypothetical protein